MNVAEGVDRRIEIYGGDYEHVLNVSQQREGIELAYHAAKPSDIFFKMIADRAYQACEFSLSNYLILKDRGADWLSAIPVFPYRAFRHSTIRVRRDSPLTTPADLRGKTIGVPDYSMTAAVWTRGILLQDYAVRWSDMRWVTSGPQRFPALGTFPIEQGNDDLETELIEGRIDALLTPTIRDDLKPIGERKLRPLIRDVVAEERRYFEQSGVYPINHLVAIRSDTLARLPDAAHVIFEAYVFAKKKAYERRLATTMLPWGERSWEIVMSLFQGDPLPYGLTDLNWKIIKMVGTFLFEQELISKPPDYPSLFVSGFPIGCAQLT